MPLESIGWNARWQKEFTAYAGRGLMPGRVVSEHRNHYRIATETAELSAEATGLVRNTAAQRSDLPGVGDFAAVRLATGDGPAMIEAVLPRISALVRKASGESRPQLLAANIDVAFIMMVMDGDFNEQRLERYLALVGASGAASVIVLNKSDLTKDVSGATGHLAAIVPGVPVHAISAHAGEGILELEQYFEGNQTVGLIGSSGVGKSTLTNKLLGRAAQATQEVRAYDNRGRHTTTHRQLFMRREGGAIIDTPGMRGVELWNTPIAVENNFEDIVELAVRCRFRDCRHENEPSCAVGAAVEQGKLNANHLASYIKLARAQLRA